MLNPAIEVSGGEVAKVNIGKCSESGEIWAYNGSVTALRNEIKLLKYNLVIVEVARRGGWIRGAQISACAVSMGTWRLSWTPEGFGRCGRTFPFAIGISYPTALRMAVYHLGRREEPYLFEQSTLLFVETHILRPAVPHFLTHNWFTEGPWLGLAILWWLVNLLEAPPTTWTTRTWIWLPLPCTESRRE